MADQKISQLTQGTPTGSDMIPYVDGASGITKKATKSSLMGPQGTQGSQGSQGSTGPQGTQGSIGVQGPQGTQGSIGQQGTQGSQGSPSTVAGPQGTQGSIGVQGTQGSQGSASTAPGVQGTQGSIGVTGAQGTQGSQGSLGATGPQGTQGSQGSIGVAGAQGTQGSQGTGNTPRVTQVATAGSPAPNADTTDTYRLTAQTLTADFVNPSGTPTNGQKMLITILASNGNRNLTFGSAYTAGGVALPTSVTQAKRTTIGFEYDTSNSLNAWMCLGSAVQV